MVKTFVPEHVPDVTTQVCEEVTDRGLAVKFIGCGGQPDPAICASNRPLAVMVPLNGVAGMLGHCAVTGAMTNWPVTEPLDCTVAVHVPVHV